MTSCKASYEAPRINFSLLHYACNDVQLLIHEAQRENDSEVRNDDKPSSRTTHFDTIYVNHGAL